MSSPSLGDEHVGAIPAPGSQKYTLLGADRRPYLSETPGQFGGHRKNKIYGRLNCPTALRAIAAGGYVASRVFFADEPTAVAAGYRPCATCMPAAHKAWKRSSSTAMAPLSSMRSSSSRFGARHQMGGQVDPDPVISRSLPCGRDRVRQQRVVLGRVHDHAGGDDVLKLARGEGRAARAALVKEPADQLPVPVVRPDAGRQGLVGDRMPGEGRELVPELAHHLGDLAREVHRQHAHDRLAGE